MESREGTDGRPAASAPAVGAGAVARPGLLDRLGGPARVTTVSGAPGSGKTMLLRSWVAQENRIGRAAWVSAGRDDRDPQRFWLSVLNALRHTTSGSALVQSVTAAPDLDGWAIVERLLEDLAPLREPVWLVIDDLHLLGRDQVLRQLELLILRAPPGLRFILATRHDIRLGLHRLRLEGELAEIRESDLRFSLAEARGLFAEAGVDLAEPVVAMLHKRTEGWAAGLRLAALSLAGHPDPERFAAEFSGSERTVAEYLLAEVLDRQSEKVRRLLLRTSILDEVTGELADLLTGDEGGQRVLSDLEMANAFVVSVDATRTRFRYHQMFADLLLLELRHAAQSEIKGLHRTASGWFAARGYPVEAIRHAQEAQEWELAAGLLAGHWPGFSLNGQATTIHGLVAGFPPAVRMADARLAAVAAADELTWGSVDRAELYLDRAGREAASAPDAQRSETQLLLGIVRLLVARQRGDRAIVADEARRLQAMTEKPDSVQPALGEELRALTLISLGETEYWTARLAESDRHLQEGTELARRIRRPFLEFSGLACQAASVFMRSFPRAAEQCRQVIELGELHGWSDKPPAALACAVLGDTLAWQGRPGAAEPWIQRAERTLRADAEPAVGLGIYYVRGVLEQARGQDAEALTAFQNAVRLAGTFAGPHFLVQPARAALVQTLLRLGDIDAAEAALAELDEDDRRRGDFRMSTAMIRLAQHEPEAATAVLGPVLDGSAPLVWPAWQAQAFLLETIARQMLGDHAAAGQALERALDLSEPDGIVLWFLLHPVPDLLARHARNRTSHASLVIRIQDLLAAGNLPSETGPTRSPVEPLSNSEIRVLRYLPTHLTVPEIAHELSVSHNTVKTHMRALYGKLGTHRRTDTVARARDLGLLAPSATRDR